MNQCKVLYVKDKSFLRRSIQNLFLKLLLKIFPKKFFSYKNKIKFIMNVSRHYIFFSAVIIYLRFKYPFYFNLPNRHIFLLDALIKFLKVLESQKIDLFLTGGSLLGAMRHESFADVRDIDLGIKEDQFPKLFNAIPLLIKSGAESIRRTSRNKSERLQVLFPFVLVDIAVYKKKKIGRKEVWIGEKDDYRSNFIGYTLPVADLENLITVKAYGKNFLCPANSEIFIEKVYGKNWRIPIQRSEINKKNFFKYKK